METIIKKVALTEDIKEQLIELSKVWMNEHICYGIVPNTDEDFKDTDIYLAYQKEELIGYLLGHKYIYEHKYAVAIEENAKVYQVDELYVIASQRSKGIGKLLFSYVENELKDEVEYFTLSTTNMDRERIFNFYLNELGMSFWSARFFKKIK